MVSSRVADHSGNQTNTLGLDVGMFGERVTLLKCREAALRLGLALQSSCRGCDGSGIYEEEAEVNASLMTEVAGALHKNKVKMKERSRLYTRVKIRTTS